MNKKELIKNIRQKLIKKYGEKPEIFSSGNFDDIDIEELKKLNIDLNQIKEYF